MHMCGWVYQASATGPMYVDTVIRWSSVIAYPPDQVKLFHYLEHTYIPAMPIVGTVLKYIIRTMNVCTYVQHKHVYTVN